MDPGKVSREFFDTHVAPNLGADREDVFLGPRHGADFGVLSLGVGRVCTLATDPVFVLRDLGLDRAAWFAFHILVSDAALSGIPPTHLALDLNLPLDADPDEVGRIMAVFDREARNLGVSIVTGHTGAYEGCAFPTVGAGTALAVGDRADLVLPTGAEPGDRLVVTKGPAIEATGLLAVCFGDDLDLPASTVAAARERFDEASPVRDALTAAATGEVTAMHDATERGVDNALHELADASRVRLSVERQRFPMGEGVRELCDYLGIDPWTCSSEGTVVLSVREGGVDTVLDALAAEGIPAAEVGQVESGSGVEVAGEALPEPTTDPLWPAYERLRDRRG